MGLSSCQIPTLIQQLTFNSQHNITDKYYELKVNNKQNNNNNNNNVIKRLFSTLLKMKSA